MSYVEQTIAPDERVVYKAKFHWLYTVYAVAWLVLCGWILGLGVLVFVIMMVNKWTTEIVITNKRLLYKRGWIARKVDEVSIDRVEGCNVEQSFLGRILGYGKLLVRGVGIGEIKLPTIDEPIGFRRAIDAAKAPA
jgi:uncharacterized membrane protein YdbT with pleckstrin-like domain